MSPDSRTGHLLTRLATFSFQRPAIVFMVLLTLGGTFAVIASHLGFRGDFIELLPDSTREVQDLKVVQEMAGGGGYFVVRLKGGDSTPEAGVSNRFDAHAHAPTKSMGSSCTASRARSWAQIAQIPRSM